MEAASFFVFFLFCTYYIFETKKIQRTARPFSLKIQDLDAPKKKTLPKIERVLYFKNEN